MLRNLAGHINPDFAIEEELRRCRIGAIRGERSAGEVGASITGWLGPFRFRRAWRYWMAEGRVPLHVAEELYADPVGVTDIRVSGDCTCPAPSDDHVKWYGDDGVRLLDFSQREEGERFLESRSPSLREASMRILAENRFVEDPSVVGRGFVDLYHIDTEIGLRLFADTLRRHGLAETTPRVEEATAC